MRYHAALDWESFSEVTTKSVDVEAFIPRCRIVIRRRSITKRMPGEIRSHAERSVFLSFEISMSPERFLSCLKSDMRS